MSRSRRLAAASGLCLAVAGSPTLGAEHTFDGTYSGQRVLTEGSPSPRCPLEEDVSVTIHGETLTFFVIEGDKAVTRYEGAGVHKGAFFDMAPTGELVRTEEISIFRVQNGLFVEQWCLIDRRA